MQMNHKEMQLVKNSRGLDPQEKAWAAGECSPMNETRPALPKSEKSTRKVSVVAEAAWAEVSVSGMSRHQACRRPCAVALHCVG